MKDIRIDDQGRQRCWNCGGLTFDHKRTARSKAMTVGALATKKKLKCQSCGEYNDVGNAKRYRGPVSKRAAIKAGTDSIDGDEFRTGHETAAASSSATTTHANNATAHNAATSTYASITSFRSLKAAQTPTRTFKHSDKHRVTTTRHETKSHAANSDDQQTDQSQHIPDSDHPATTPHAVNKCKLPYSVYFDVNTIATPHYILH